MHIPSSIEELEKACGEFLPDLRVQNRLSYSDKEFANFYSGNLIVLIHFNKTTKRNLVCIDNFHIYKKESECSVFLEMPMSDKKEKRLKKILDILRTQKYAKEGRKFPRFRWEEFNDTIRWEYYQY